MSASFNEIMKARQGDAPIVKAAKALAKSHADRRAGTYRGPTTNATDSPIVKAAKAVARSTASGTGFIDPEAVNDPRKKKAGSPTPLLDAAKVTAKQEAERRKRLAAIGAGY